MYNILDCVVCVEYLGLTFFFFDMAKGGKSHDCQIIVDALGNIIVLKLAANEMQEDSESEDEDAYWAEKKPLYLFDSHVS